jgi:hypothetical protein
MAQLRNLNVNHKLHTNQSIGQTPVTVSMEMDGIHFVSIFVIREGVGIVNSTPFYSTEVFVSEECTTTTTSATTSEATTLATTSKAKTTATINEATRTATPAGIAAP